MRSTNSVAGRIVAALLLAALTAGCGRAASQVTKSAASRTRARLAAILARDAARDRGTRTVILQTERKVFRYTTPQTAAREAREGFRAGAHFTSRARPGRPPSEVT